MHGTEGLIQVRMIGPLEVTRADGTVVDACEWKTAKTRDLFRLLVLEGGRMVRTERILDALWPDVDRTHGTASLRTAASRIRTVTRSSCVVRQDGGLAIQGAWSDVDELRSLQTRLRQLATDHRHDALLQAAAPHERLLSGDLYADVLNASSSSDDTWAEEARDRVAEMQREVLTLQAESATAVGRLHDAVDLARRAVDSDPFWERPYRVMMRALAGLGEADRALRVYERLRTTLEEDLGVEPSTRTRQVRDSIAFELESVPPGPTPLPLHVPSPRPEPVFEMAAVEESVPLPDVDPIPSAPTSILRIPAEPGWGGSFEQYVLRWLRDRAHGATVRIQASLVGEPRQVFALDITSGIDGFVELVEEPQLRGLPTG